MHPNLAERVERKQEGQKAAHDTKAAERSFQEQDSVYAKYYERGRGRMEMVARENRKMQGAIIVWLEDGRFAEDTKIRYESEQTRLMILGLETDVQIFWRTL